MATVDQIATHDEEGPDFAPLFYGGEEFEEERLGFGSIPYKDSIENYFDYRTPVIIKREAESKLRSDHASRNRQQNINESRLINSTIQTENPGVYQKSSKPPLVHRNNVGD